MLPFPSLHRTLPGLFLAFAALVIAALTIAALTIALPAQQPTDAQQPTVRLEPHDGKTTFYIGQPIQLDLVFQNTTGSPFLINLTGYGDLSEKVDISPTTGWSQWQTTSSHDYSNVTDLKETPLRVPVNLDEGFVFHQPGEYQVRVTTARLTPGKFSDNKPSLPPITTNQLTITLQQMPSQLEDAQLQQIRTDIASANPGRAAADLRNQAMRRIATLQSEDALREKVELLKNGNPDFRSVYREAFASTQDLHQQLKLLLEAWSDPSLTPQYDTLDAIDETRLLLARRNLAGWVYMAGGHKQGPVEQQLAADHRAPMAALLASMPLRQGESRTMAAYFLIEFGGLTEVQRAQAIDYAVEEFPHMDDTSQRMLLDTARPPLRDPRFVPMLRPMLAADPTDRDALNSVLLMDPANTATWITSALCSSDHVIVLDTVKEARVDRVPAVDACMASLLRTSPSTARDQFNWNMRVVEAARFATPAILPAVRHGWTSPDQDRAMLALLLRDDPTAAIQLLNKAFSASTLDPMLFYETSSVYKQLQEPFPAPVRLWLQSQLQNGTEKQAYIAAYALSIGGDASDAALVVQRMQSLRLQSQGKPPTEELQQKEMDLASVLGSFDSRLFLSKAERRQLGEGCMSDQCRRYLH